MSNVVILASGQSVEVSDTSAIIAEPADVQSLYISALETVVSHDALVSILQVEQSQEVIVALSEVSVVEAAAQGPVGATGATGSAGPGVATGGTAGQVLQKVDASDYNTIWVDPDYTTAAGVNGHVQFNDDGDFQGDARFVWNESSGYLGIGTASPAARLDIVGEGNVSQVKVRQHSVQSSPTVVVENSAGSELFRLHTENNSNFCAGYQAGKDISTGQYNTFLGWAGYEVTSGQRNVAVGYDVLNANKTGSYNVAIGDMVMRSTTSSYNVAIGSYASNKLQTGISNCVLGYAAMRENTTGSDNLALGVNALREAKGYVFANVAIGRSALDGGTSAIQHNVAIGRYAGDSINGHQNVVIGSEAGRSLTTGDGNIAIGFRAEVESATTDHQMSIGNLIYGTGVDGQGTSISSGKIGIRTKVPDVTLDVEGDGVLLPCPDTAIADAYHANSQFSVSVDESGHTLNFKVKYSNGTVKTGSVSLS